MAGLDRQWIRKCLDGLNGEDGKTIPLVKVIGVPLMNAMRRMKSKIRWGNHIRIFSKVINFGDEIS